MSLNKHGIPLPPVIRPSVMFAKVFGGNTASLKRQQYLLESGRSLMNEVTADAKRLSSRIIRKLLLAKPEIFTRCLLTKLLEYGTGRKLSIGDQRTIDRLVRNEPDGGYRFQDLIEAAVTSEVFLAK